MARWYLEYFFTPRTSGNIEKPERVEVPLKSMTEEGAIAEAKELWAEELAKVEAREEKDKKHKKTSDDVFKYRPFSPHAVQKHSIGI